MASKDYWNDHVGDDLHETENKIHGWLTAFLVVVGCNIARKTINLTLGFSFGDYLNNSILAATDITATIAAVSLGIYTIIAFRRRMNNAVLIGRMYLTVNLVMQLLGLLALSQTTEAFNPWARVLAPVAWFLIWFTFLNSSQQVKRLFPVENRRAGKFDYLLGALCIIVPGVLLLIGLKTL